eukprot:scaffold10112_cov141-Ochromonas_danica.AAC.4
MDCMNLPPVSHMVQIIVTWMKAKKDILRSFDCCCLLVALALRERLWLFASPPGHSDGLLHIHFASPLRASNELRTFSHSDEEAIILLHQQALNFEVECCLQEFSDVGVDYMKGEPSKTSQHQQFDVSFKKDLNQQAIVANRTLSDALDAHIQDLRNRFQDDTNVSGHKVLLREGIIRLCRVLCNKAVTSDKIAQEGFVICGHHVEKQRARAVLQQVGKHKAKEAKKLAEKEEEMRRKQSMTKSERDEEAAAIKAAKDICHTSSHILARIH